MGTNRIPQIPLKSVLAAKSGFISEPWSKFILKVYERLKILQNEFIILDVSRDESTSLTTGTGKYYFKIPFAFDLSEVRASVNTAPTSSTIIIDINKDGTSILSTKLTIDIDEKSSFTAATSYVISDRVIAEDSEISIDIDQIGSGIAGKGLKVYLLGSRP